MWLYDRANTSIHAALRAKRTLRRLDPMGEKQNQPFQLSFNPSLKVDFQGSRVTSDGGLLLVRELDESLGVERTHRRTLDRLTREEHAIADGRSVASGGVQPIGRL